MTDIPGAYHFLLPVWGASYTTLFLDIALPSHLASGNLAALANKHPCLYHIFTCEADLPLFNSSPVFKQLQNLLPVKITLIQENIVLPHDTMSNCYRQGIALADKANAAIVFLTPDLVFSQNSFRYMARIAQTGKRVINITGIRLNKTKASSALYQHLDPQKNSLALKGRQLMDLALLSLHPITLHHFFEGTEDNKDFVIPACLLWHVHNQGLVSRSFHLHPLMVYPRNKHMGFIGTVDDDYASLACPLLEDSYVVTNSDTLLACELSDLSRGVRTPFKQGNVSDIANWAHIHTLPYHLWLAGHTIQLKSSQYVAADWQATIQKADQTMQTILKIAMQSSTQLFFSHPLTFIRKSLKHMRLCIKEHQYGIDQRLQKHHHLIKLFIFKIILSCHQVYIRIRTTT